MHENGQEIGTIDGSPVGFTDGRTGHDLIMGRLYVDDDSNYGSSEIGELVIWETVLKDTQINQVFDSY